KHDLVVYLISGFGACLLSLIATPIVRHIARHRGFVDRPDGHRKTHREPVALGGGAAILLSVLGIIGIILAYASFSGFQLITTSNFKALAGLAVGAVGIVVLGLVDDFVGLRG